MLRLTTAATSLDLDPRASITMQVFNPAFDDAIVGRVFSFPFRLPNTGRNLRALSHINRLDAKNVSLSIPAVLHIETAQFPGFLEVGQVSAESIEVVFKNRERKLSAALSDIKINEILETITIAEPTVPLWFIEFLPDNFFSIKINGLLFSHTGTPFDSMIFIIDAINAVFPGVASAIAISPPTLRLEPGANNPFNVEIFTPASLTLLSYNNFASARLENWHLHYEVQRTSPASSHRFPVVFNPYFFKTGDNSAFNSYLNYRHGTTEGRNTPETTKKWAFSFVPFVVVRYIFEKITEHISEANYAFAGFFDDPDFQKILVYNNLALDAVMQDYFTDFSETRFLNVHQNSYDLNQHVPETSALDFLTKILGTLNLFTHLQGDTIVLRKRADFLNQTPVDWTSKVAPGYDMTAIIQAPPLMSFISDKNDTFSDAQLQDFDPSGAGSFKIETPLRPLAETLRTDNIQGDNWKVATIFALGLSREFGNPKSEADPRLFFDLGLQPDADDDDEYWQGSKSGTDSLDTELTDFQLDWPSNRGLYQKLWKNWAEILANVQTIKIPVRLEGHEIEELQRWENPLRYFRTRQGAVNVIIKSLEFRQTVGS